MRREYDLEDILAEFSDYGKESEVPEVPEAPEVSARRAGSPAPR